MLTNKIKPKHLVKVRSFSGVMINCMSEYVIPTLREVNPDHIILRAGANELRTENTASQIARAAIDSKTSLAFHERGLYHIETSPLIFAANQWTCFYMIGTSVVKELKIN